MRAAVLPPLLLGACAGGPSDETLVDTLQVVAVVAEPPEIDPGETTTVTPYVADPENLGAEVLQWTCTPAESGCAEALVPGFGVAIGSPAYPPITFWQAPSELAYLFAKDPTLVLPVLVWTLACAPGACDLVDAVGAAPEPGTEAGESLAAALADPTAPLADLPIEAVSLSLQTFGVSARGVEERVTNPVFLSTPDPEVGGVAGEEVTLAFTLEVPDGASLWGYTTASGFTQAAVEPDDEGLAELTLVVPEAGTVADLWVVAIGGEGGSTVWRGRATGE